ncbi:MAG TPA: hypothetical protein VM821_00950 [Abditibacteriaceae bacterium]|jgi:uncharacterized membrane protein|nr:hypothetical protein [Abditibacteriaceae bacterium]
MLKELRSKDFWIQMAAALVWLGSVILFGNSKGMPFVQFLSIIICLSSCLFAAWFDKDFVSKIKPLTRTTVLSGLVWFVIGSILIWLVYQPRGIVGF